MCRIKKLLKKALDYYYAIKEIISEKNKSKYKSLPPEQKNKRQENTKRWLDKQSPKKRRIKTKITRTS